VKEKRWVVFKGEHDPTSIPGIYFMVAIVQLLKLLVFCPHLLIHVILFHIIDGLLMLIILVEWICWLNGQRKRAPTPEVN
jgi:hypothetical protein